MIHLRSRRYSHQSSQAEENDETQKPNVKELQQLPRPFTTPATTSLCRNLRPPENFISTLAGIAAAVHSGADSDDAESPQAYFHPRRPTTTGGARSARRQKLAPLATTRKPPGELRRTDVREYGTLERLLHPDLQPVAEEEDVERLTTSTSKAVTIEDIENIVMNKAHDDVPDYLLSHASHRRRRKHTENSLQQSSSLKQGRQSSKNSSMFGSRRPSMVAGPLQRQSAVFRGSRLMSDESTDSDSSDSESACSSSQSSSRSLLRELSTTQQQADWHSLIQLARERTSCIAPTAGNAPTDETIPSKSLRASPIDELLEDEDNARLDAFSAFSTCSRQGFNRDTITTEASTKRKLKGRSKGPRPRSPLRPGVYVGHEASKHALVLASRKKPPPGLPTAAQAGDGHAAVQQETKKEQVEEKHEVVRNKRVITWNDMVRELEDQRHAEEAQQYNAWRKRVIECARNMQTEVSRFKLDER